MIEPTIRERLRSDLTAAMKARQPNQAAALRTLIAAIDNAEAVPLPEGFSSSAPPRMFSLAGDVPRRELSAAEITAILRREAAECQRAIAEYQQLDRSAEIERLQEQHACIVRYLPADVDAE